MHHEAPAAMTGQRLVWRRRMALLGVDALSTLSAHEDRRGAAARPDADGRTNATTSKRYLNVLSFCNGRAAARADTREQRAELVART